MRYSVERTNLVISIIGVVLAVFFVAWFLFRGSLLDQTPRYPVQTLNEGWIVTHNGRDISGERLDRTRFSDVRIKDTATLETALPEENIPGAALFFRTLQSAVEVELDGEIIYSYGQDLHEEGRMLKRGLCMANLPAGYEGKTVIIRFMATEPGAFSGLAPVRFGNENDLIRKYIEECRLALFFGIFLVVYAILQLLWMPYLLIRESASARPLFSALISLLSGLYILGYYHLFELITNRQSASTFIEYGSLYLLPLVLSAYLWTLMSGRLRRFYFYCMMTDIALFLFACTLHAMGLAHLTLFLPIVYIVAFVESMPYILLTQGGLTGYTQTANDELNRLADRLAYVGYTIFVAGALLDMVFFVQAKYFGAGESLMGIPFITMGAILFTMALTAQYFLHGVAHLRADVTREQLEARAYTDPLTGLANRIRSEQEMQNLKITDPFVIISLDMDGLKKVNDSLGHAEGDRMLLGFSSALKKCFGDMTLVGRMGGDEFLVILTGAQCAMVNAKLKEFERSLFDLNLEEHHFYYSASYGYATNQETHYGRRVRDIYMLADRRMYDMKRKRKQEREAES